MGTSAKQRERVRVVCKCGCETVFMAFPVYRPRAEGGGLRVPEYFRGHHPNCKKSKPAWNRGLTKEDHPSIARMGYQPGHPPFGDWSKVNERLKNDPILRKKWLSSKKGQTPWNRGLTRPDYPNGIASGPDHGNWNGGCNGARDTSEYRLFTQAVLARDKFTCTECGARNHKGLGHTVRLEVHHVKPVWSHPDLVMFSGNCVTLCKSCHFKTDSFGSKAARAKLQKRLKQ